MSVAGQVVEVRLVSHGSSLVGAHASGATSLVVADPTDFDNRGGLLLLDGNVYAWTSVVIGTGDEPTATLTVTPGLVQAEPDTMPVELWMGTQVIDDMILSVDTGGEAPVSVYLRSDERINWMSQLGLVDPPVAVTLSDDQSALEDVPNYTPVVQAAGNVATSPSGPRAELLTATDQRVGYAGGMARFVSAAGEGPSMAAFIYADVSPAVSFPFAIPASPRLRICGPTLTGNSGMTPELQFVQQTGSGTRGQIYMPNTNFIPESTQFGGIGARLTGFDGGNAVFTTNASGVVTIAHTLGITPTVVQLTGTTVGRAYTAKISAVNNSTITAVMVDGSNTPAPGGTSIGLHWEAKVLNR